MNLLASIMFLCAISCCSSQDEEMCTIEDDCDPAQSSNINFLGPPTGTTVYSPPDPILLACEASGELDTVLWIRENSDGESKVLSSTLITAIIPNVLIRADLRDFPPVDKFPYTYQCLAYGKCCEEHKSPSATVNILSVTPTAAVTPTTDIDECLGENSCHDNATCTNVVGSYNCSCNDGFQGDGTNCEDIDECADGSHTCHNNAICTDTVGSFTCECNAGFSGNGSSCEEINECQQPGGCPENAICTDQLGRCEYTCKSGFEGSSCSDLIVDHQEDIPLNFWTVSIVNDITNVEIRKSFVTENELCFDGVIAINCARDVIDGWKINLTSSQHLSLLNASDATIFHSETNSFFILESVQWNHRCLTGEVIQISFAGCTPQNDTLPQITVEFDRNENLCPKISPPADRKSIEVPAILIHNNNSTFRASLNITLPVTVQGNWAIYLAISTQLFQLSAPGVSFSPKQGDIFTLTNLRWREMFMANETHTLEISGYKAAKGFTTPCIAAAFVWENDMEEHHSTVPPA